MKEELVLQTPKGPVNLDPLMTKHPIRLLGDRVLIRLIPFKEKTEDGKFYRPVQGKHAFAEGVLESLGNEPPHTHKHLVVDQKVWFYHQTGVPISISADPEGEYFTVRYADVWSEV